MSTKANYFKLGLFVVTAVTACIIVVAVLGAGALFKKYIIVETYIDGSVQGLNVGSAVKYRGVPMGKVSEISAVSWEYKTEARYILVRAAFPEDNTWFKSEQYVRQMIKAEAERGLRIRMATPGVTGAAFLEVDYMDPLLYPPLEFDWIPKYPHLPSAPSYITRISDSLAAIMDNLERINLEGLISRLETTMEAISSSLSGANISKLSDQASSLLQELRETNLSLQRLVAGKKTAAIFSDAAAALSGVRRIVENSEEPVADFLGSLDQASRSVATLAAKLDRTTKDLPQILARLKTTLRRLDDLVAIPQESLEETMDNIRQISYNLRVLSENSKEYPSYLLFGEPPPRLRPGVRK